MDSPTVEYITGLDLGQVSDPTALAVLERSQADDPEDVARLETRRARAERARQHRAAGGGLADLATQERMTLAALCEELRRAQAEPNARPRQAWFYRARHLERFPLGTPYPAVGERLVELFSTAPLAGSTLVVDRTRVGRAVYDQLRKLPIQARIVPVTITAGHHAAPDGPGWTVPKKDLVAALQVLLQCRPQRILVAKGLPEAQTLVKELHTFRVKITKAANETYEAWREGDHDDLVLAVACAAWVGEKARRQIGLY